MKKNEPDAPAPTGGSTPERSDRVRPKMLDDDCTPDRFRDISEQLAELERRGAMDTHIPPGVSPSQKGPDLKWWLRKHPHSWPPSDPEGVCSEIRRAGTAGELRGALFVLLLWLILPHSVWVFVKKMMMAMAGLLGFATG